MPFFGELRSVKVGSDTIDQYIAECFRLKPEQDRQQSALSGLAWHHNRTFLAPLEQPSTVIQNQPTIGTVFKLGDALKIKPSKLVAEAEKLIVRR